ncbi:MAG: transposase [Deltaproteobacteria bacterium]|nr:transposase [Deltaproteobacteria bacterium]
MSNPIAKKADCLLDIPCRLKQVAFAYLLSLMLPGRKHSLTQASQVGSLHKSQFSRFLRRHGDLAVESLQRTAARTCRAIQRPPVVAGGPWTIAILIDATLQSRSSRHSGNSHKFSHGKGYVIGHQWTNILLLINGKKIPLPPLAWISGRERKRRGLKKETEQEAVIRYLSDLDLSQYVGTYENHEVVVLADSGYDNKKLQASILSRGWDFVFSMKSSRGSRLSSQKNAGAQGNCSVADLFRKAKIFPWKTIRAYANGWKRRKRKEFRARELTGFISGITDEVRLVLSEERGSRRGRKYLVCSNIRVRMGAIVRVYRKRWEIELFHKDVKSLMGFEDVSCHDFQSVESHVHWVYCAWLLLPEISGKSGSVLEAMTALQQEVELSPFKHLIQLSTRIHGFRDVQRYCREVINANKAA